MRSPPTPTLCPSHDCPHDGEHNHSCEEDLPSPSCIVTHIPLGGSLNLCSLCLPAVTPGLPQQGVPMGPERLCVPWSTCHCGLTCTLCVQEISGVTRATPTFPRPYPLQFKVQGSRRDSLGANWEESGQEELTSGIPPQS